MTKMQNLTTSQQLSIELLEELRYIRAHTSRTAELLATGVRNHVLQVGQLVFPAAGMVQLVWQATCGAIVVRNLSEAEDIVVAGGPASVVPTGVGSWTVPAGARDVVNVNSRVVTLYGVEDERCCYQAFTIGAPPGVE